MLKPLITRLKKVFEVKEGLTHEEPQNYQYLI
jgi:hypothetical protein